MSIRYHRFICEETREVGVAIEFTSWEQSKMNIVNKKQKQKTLSLNEYLQAFEFAKIKAIADLKQIDKKMVK